MKSKSYKKEVRQTLRNLTLFQGDADRQALLYQIQTVYYKTLIKQRQVDIPFPIKPDQTGIIVPFLAYDKLYDEYNDITLDVLKALEKNKTDTYCFAKMVLNGNKPRHYKKINKCSTKILATIKQGIRDGAFGKLENKQAFYREVCLFHYSFKACFGKACITVGKKRFDRIPESLEITLHNDTNVLIIDLFKYNEANYNYRLKTGCGINKTDIENIQYTIAPYIFSMINPKEYATV